MLETIAPFIIGLAIAQEVTMYALRNTIKKQDELFHDLYEIAEKRMDLIEDLIKQRDGYHAKATWFVNYSERMVGDLIESLNVVEQERSRFIQHRMAIRAKELDEYEAVNLSSEG